MATQTPKFNSLDEVLERLHLLQKEGYTRRGNWSLGQNCNHLAVLMEFSQRFGNTLIGRFLEKIGFPVLVMRFGSIANRLGIRLPTLPFARPKQAIENDDTVGVQRLTDALAKQKCRVGAKACTRFQLWHCGHHLSFLTLRDQASN